jgi:CxxC-x17-CxxC domain-containing protein
MEAVNPEYKHLVASGLIGVFKKIWADSWGPRLEYILRNAILALLEYPGSTLLGVTRILVDKKYRDRVVEKVTDPVVKQFWVDEFTKWNERTLAEVISPIQNKVGQFLSSSLIRNIVGQTQSSFDVRELMDQKKILILNLSKGRIGEDNSALLGAMMITKIQLAAMGRVDIPEETRADFYLYVDEFQNFATESFANILSEARKYHLNLILANQYIEQIDEKVRNAIFGNTGTIISFRVGAMDAEFLEKEFTPVFLQNDIVNLAKYNIYLKLMIDGIAGDAFSATTLPPVYLGETIENEQKIIASSRERYTADRAEVEEKISRWSGMLVAEKMQNIVAANVTSQQVAQPRSFVEYANQKEEVNLQNTFAQNKKNNTQNVQAPAAPIVNQPYQASANVVSQQPPQQAVPIQRDAEQEYLQSIPVEPPKPMFDAVCDTCSVEMRVPFKPDGKRPTFCKDCLKDYQRMMAKAKEGEERKRLREQTVPEIKNPVQNSVAQVNPQIVQNQAATPAQNFNAQAKQVERKVYASKDKPMTLSQMQRIAPKGFNKAPRPRPSVDLGAVRNMINDAKEEN